LLRIVRHIAQYFYPQSQTKVMNEGTATYVHYRIMNRLHEQGRITDGNFLEFLQSHTNVVFQPDFDDRRFSGFNPYALGFAMMQDIERIVTDPDDEDREWFPEIAGKATRWRCCAISGPITATRASSASSSARG
jgi:stage V sporulation protein R